MGEKRIHSICTECVILHLDLCALNVVCCKLAMFVLVVILYVNVIKHLHLSGRDEYG